MLLKVREKKARREAERQRQRREREAEREAREEARRRQQKEEARRKREAQKQEELLQQEMAKLRRQLEERKRREQLVRQRCERSGHGEKPHSEGSITLIDYQFRPEMLNILFFEKHWLYFVGCYHSARWWCEKLQH